MERKSVKPRAASERKPAGKRDARIAGQVRLGNTIRERRKELKLSLKDLGARVAKLGVDGGSKSHLSAVELGSAWPDQELAEALDEVLGMEGEILGQLVNAKFPRVKTIKLSPRKDRHLTAHLIYPLRVDEQPEPELATPSNPSHCVPSLGPLATTNDPEAGVTATLHSFPFGVVVLHETTDMPFENLSDLPAWRSEKLDRAHDIVLSKLSEHGHTKTRSVDREPYGFSVFVVNDLPWSEHEERTKVTHMLSNPSVLRPAEGDTTPDQNIHRLVRSNESVDDVVDFSHTGNHYGAATWASAAVWPQTASTVSHQIVTSLVEFEIQLQAFWCYANNVGLAGESHVRQEYEESFLRRTLASLECPAATEHTSVRRLREALTSTSRIHHVVERAIQALQGSR